MRKEDQHHNLMYRRKDKALFNLTMFEMLFYSICPSKKMNKSGGS